MFEQTSHSRASGHARPLPWTHNPPDPLERQVLERLPLALAVIDTRGRMLFCNSCARALANGSDAMCFAPDGRMFFLDELFERRFHRVVHQLVRETPTGHNSAMLVMNRAGCPQMPLIVSIEVLPQDFPGTTQTLLITFTDPACTPSETRMSRLLQSFGLTPAEQRLARHLATGGHLDDAAQAFGLSKHTVRNQLRAVFAKLGVQRQVDLTRLLLAGCGIA